MRHFTAAEADDALDLVPVLEEADDVVFLEIEVVLVDSGAELHLLDDDHLLLLFRLGLFLLLLEQVLAIVHDLADRGSGRGGDLDEVEILLTSHLLGLRDRKSTRLNSSHSQISYAVFCLKKKKIKITCRQIVTSCANKHIFITICIAINKY